MYTYIAISQLCSLKYFNYSRNIFQLCSLKYISTIPGIIANYAPWNTIPGSLQNIADFYVNVDFACTVSKHTRNMELAKYCGLIVSTLSQQSRGLANCCGLLFQRWNTTTGSLQNNAYYYYYFDILWMFPTYCDVMCLACATARLAFARNFRRSSNWWVRVLGVVFARCMPSVRHRVRVILSTDNTSTINSTNTI